MWLVCGVASLGWLVALLFCCLVFWGGWQEVHEEDVWDVCLKGRVEEMKTRQEGS